MRRWAPVRGLEHSQENGEVRRGFRHAHAFFAVWWRKHWSTRSGRRNQIALDTPPDRWKSKRSVVRRRPPHARCPATGYDLRMGFLPCGKSGAVQEHRNRGFVAPCRQFGHHGAVRPLVAEAAQRRFAVPSSRRPQNQLRVQQKPALAEARRFYDLPYHAFVQPRKARQEQDRLKAQAGDGNQCHVLSRDCRLSASVIFHSCFGCCS
jgi:hypothetical protein